MESIKWNRSDEGYVDSKCGRFEIHPLYFSCVSPTGYEVYIFDENDKRQKIGYNLSTQTEAKHKAMAWLEHDTLYCEGCNKYRDYCECEE